MSTKSWKVAMGACMAMALVASAMADDFAEFFWAPQGKDPAGFGGDLFVDVVAGDNPQQLCFELYARSLTGWDFGSLGGEIVFRDHAAFSGGGRLDADCTTATISGAPPFGACSDWRTHLTLVDNCGAAGTGDRVKFVHAVGAVPAVKCPVPTVGGLYFAEVCYDVSAHARGSAEIKDPFVVSLHCCEETEPVCFRTLTIRVVDCMENADCNDDVCTDCNDNGVIDACDIATGASEDCTGNAIPDECEIEPDCNANGLSDSNDICNGFSVDCNTNAIPDECDIAAGTSQDVFPTTRGGDGVPDECQTREFTPGGL